MRALHLKSRLVCEQCTTPRLVSERVSLRLRASQMRYTCLDYVPQIQRCCRQRPHSLIAVCRLTACCMAPQLVLANHRPMKTMLS